MPLHHMDTVVAPDWHALDRCLRRQGTPDRVHLIELFFDPEIEAALTERFNLMPNASPDDDPFYYHKRRVAIHRYLGFDYIRCSLDDFVLPLNRDEVADTADLSRQTGRSYVNEHVGPITDWASFERYPWPDVDALPTHSLDWFSEHVPEDMCLIGSGGMGHYAEYLTWLMGYETLCFALYDQRDLVQAISDKLMELYERVIHRVLKYERVKFIWGSDDMGFRSGTLIGPDDLRAFVLPGHKRLAEASHAAGLPYLLHSCGKLDDIMPDLIDDVGIDAKHSFEDTIEDVADAKRKYGHRIAMLGGIDVDFLCRSDEDAVRARVRRTLEQCHEGGGYCLGTGNSVANYIPVDNYLAMVDEGRRFTA